MIYSEPHAVHWPYLELVVKNLGTTAAYDVQLPFSPEPVAAPYQHHTSGEWITHLAYPRMCPSRARAVVASPMGLRKAQPYTSEFILTNR